MNGVTAAEHASRALVLDELRSGQRFVLATHENPDGDAIGSLAAMGHLLRALGKDVVLFLAAGELPLPLEYRFIGLDGLVHEPPADLEDRVVVFLDCGNIDRNPAEAFKREDVHVLNIDHHHDNTRFGTVDHVVPEASCTAEIVWDLARSLGVELTVPMAEALWVGLVTDTGRFMYETTGPRAHIMAADLVSAGIDVHAIYRRLYEEMPEAKLRLLARALARVERFDGGLLTLTHVTRDDFDATGAEEGFTEGVVDHLRAVQGTAVAGVARELAGDKAGKRKVSLRATDDRVDVSAIARAEGGGGHRRAAGFTTERDWPELVAFVREQLAAQL